jgi:hypothetical protein
MNTDPELAQWQQQWQASSPAAPDVEALIATARRRNRREKVVTALEVLLGFVAVAGCLATALAPDLHALERAGLLGAAVLAGGFVMWVYRQRRRNWLPGPVDAARLIELERQRLRTRIRYWRVNLWGVAALLLFTLAAAVFHGVNGTADATRWAVSAVALLAIVITTGLLSAMVRKRAERQLERLDDLDSSAAPP